MLYVGLVALHFPLVSPKEFYDLHPLALLPQPKLHPSAGYKRHPWVQAYADFAHNEEALRSPGERLAAFSAYFGLCSYTDQNVDLILAALREAGLDSDTTVVYTSDHGDNVGARGLWGKSTLYQESVSVPRLLAGPGVPRGVCRTPVDLLDLYPTILQAAGVDPMGFMDARPWHSLLELAGGPEQPQRLIFSECHAAGSKTAGFMLRKGRCKYHYCVRFAPALFDLGTDPGELTDLAAAAA